MEELTGCKSWVQNGEGWGKEQKERPINGGKEKKGEKKKKRKANTLPS